MYVVVDEGNENVIIVKLVEDVEWRLIYVKNVVIVVKFGGYFVVKIFMKQVNIFIYLELKFLKICDGVSVIVVYLLNLILVIKSYIEIYVFNKLVVGKKIFF